MSNTVFAFSWIKNFVKVTFLLNYVSMKMVRLISRNFLNVFQTLTTMNSYLIPHVKLTSSIKSCTVTWFHEKNWNGIKKNQHTAVCINLLLFNFTKTKLLVLFERATFGGVHGVEISGFFCHSDFLWNQFQGFERIKAIETLIFKDFAFSEG